MNSEWRLLRSAAGHIQSSSTFWRTIRQIGHGTVIAVDGKLILFSDPGELILAHATTERFEELARVSVLAVCLLYFLVCRRLRLVFEWVFLGGFFAAVRFSLAARHLFRTCRWYVVWQVLATAAAFAAFYWSSVAFLYLRVQ